MDYDLDQYDNKRLLELLSQTFQNWKRLEKLCLEKEGVYIRQNDNRYNGQTLRDTYICLLKEARKRDLSLTSEQLLANILYSKALKKRGYPKIETHNSKDT